MVNDTTTLNGALSELGETLASNITSKGVSASASDGLTTLANKVLQISGGGGSSITLSSNKNILSYYDSESATLTATYQSGATMELYNASTNTKIGNFTDNTDGTYTYTYSANGTGDIYLKAKVGSTMSEPILIEDCYLYAPTEISRTSIYTTDHLTEMFNNFSFESNNYVVEADIKFEGASMGFGTAPINTSSLYHHITFGNSYQSGNKLSFYTGKQSSGENTYRYDFINLDTYYNLKYEFSESSVTTYVDNVEKGTYSSLSYMNDETRTLVWQEWDPNRTAYAKNIKVKSLESNAPYSPCTQYITEIDNAIEYINGSGS